MTKYNYIISNHNGFFPISKLSENKFDEDFQEHVNMEAYEGYTGCGLYYVAVVEGKIIGLKKAERTTMEQFEDEFDGAACFTAEGSCGQLMEWSPL